jgi:hypothetical protein
MKIGERAVGSGSASECGRSEFGVAVAEVSAVDWTGPVSESVVNESNGGDADSSIGDGADDADGDDGGGDKGDDLADDVSVLKTSDGCGEA